MKDLQATEDKQPAQTITYVASAYNEEANLKSLYRECLKAYAEICNLSEVRLQFELLIVDNCSSDGTAAVIRELMKLDSRVKGIRNLRNYGPEPSFMQGLKTAKGDLIILLCADLQDPPMLTVEMVRSLLDGNESYDAVLACKQRSSGNSSIRMFRKLYYRLLDFSDRDSHVPPGFHGFGCYRTEVIDQALDLWRQTAMNMRHCLSKAAMNPAHVSYVQPDRVGGRSSYSFRSYVAEASSGIVAGKSLASRISMRFGIIVFSLSLLLGLFVLLNYLTGKSGYAPGVPTLAILILMSSSFQVIMLSLVSRQIETGLHLPVRPRVRSMEL